MTEFYESTTLHNQTMQTTERILQDPSYNNTVYNQTIETTERMLQNPTYNGTVYSQTVETTESMLQDPTYHATVYSQTIGTTKGMLPDLSFHDTLLSRENSIEAKLLIPVTVYLVILMIIGVTGNITVLYIYKFRFRRSTSRVFILSLAFFDMVTCIFGMPYHILDMTFPLKFVWNEVCKSLSFVLTFTNLGSTFVLDLIAIDRYRKICTPLQKQLSSVGTKIICWVTVVISGILAIPILFIYGTADVDTKIPNVTGKECYISSDFLDTSFPIIYDAFNIVFFTTSVCILTGLYIKVGIDIKKRNKFHETIYGSKKSTTDSMGSFRDPSACNLRLENVKGKDAVVHKNSKGNESKMSYSPCNSPRIQRKEKKNKFKKEVKRVRSDVSSSEYDSSGTLERGQTLSNDQNKQSSGRQRRTMRITWMLFIITLIFVISFLPYLIIQGMNSMDESFWKDMEMWELVVYNFLMRTYFINNMINPIVYWCLDRKFKEELKRLLNNLVKCKLQKSNK